MFNKLLATTAVVALLSGSAYAQEATQPAPAAPAPMTDDAAQAPVAKSDGILASNLIGETVYNGTGDDAANIGNVNDVVISSTGQIEAVVVGVGGFLGIGEKNVALNFSDVSWAERDGDRWIVVNSTKEQLEAQAEFDRTPYMPAVAAAPATDTTAMAPADDMAAAPAPAAPAPAEDTAAAPAQTDAMAPADQAAQAPADGTAAAPAEDTAAAPAQTDAMAPADQTAQAPADGAMAPADGTAAAPATDQTQTSAIDKSTLTEVPAGEMRTEDMVGTTVYGANDANLGEIGDVVLTQDGKVDAVLIDVGGFLGIGEKEVAVGMDKLAFMTDADGNRYLYTTLSKEQLDAAPAYDESTWADQRDQQRIMVQ